MRALIHTYKGVQTVIQIEVEEFPVNPEAHAWVDIGGVNPQPQVGWTYDGVDFTAPPPLAKEPLVDRINDATMWVIVSNFPEWKQRNTLARMLELEAELRMGNTLSAGELAEETQARSVWTWVKAVRVVSNGAVVAQTEPEDIVWPPYPV